MDEPSGGLCLQEAYDRFVDPEKLRALEAARAAPGARKRIVTRGSRESRERWHAHVAYSETIKDFRDLFVSGELVAWGSIGMPTAPRTRISVHAWPYLTPVFQSQTLRGPEKQKIFGVRVHVEERADDRKGRSGKALQPPAAPETQFPANNVAAPRAKKPPIYTEVSQVWDSIRSSVGELLDKHGGKKQVATMIADRLPHRDAASVEREFRRRRNDESKGESGKKAE